MKVRQGHYAVGIISIFIACRWFNTGKNDFRLFTASV